jgi:hypothetical protein
MGAHVHFFTVTYIRAKPSCIIFEYRSNRSKLASTALIYCLTKTGGWSATTLANSWTGDSDMPTLQDFDFCERFCSPVFLPHISICFCGQKYVYPYYLWLNKAPRYTWNHSCIICDSNSRSLPQVSTFQSMQQSFQGCSVWKTTLVTSQREQIILFRYLPGLDDLSSNSTSKRRGCSQSNSHWVAYRLSTQATVLPSYRRLITLLSVLIAV